MPQQRDIVGNLEYGPAVKRHSVDNPFHQHRHSSIPFVDRSPQVQFIRSVEPHKSTSTGPFKPSGGDASKPVLKKNEGSALTLLQHEKLKGVTSSTSQFATSNDELEGCRMKAESIMDIFSNSERIGRSALDVLTFPLSNPRRIEALSRFGGSMTLSAETLSYHTSSSEFSNDRNKKQLKSTVELQSVLEVTSTMVKEAKTLCSSARKFRRRSKKCYKVWEKILRRNHEFKMEHGKLSFPIYTHQEMPESVTIFEDSLIAEAKANRNHADGNLSLFRQYPDGKTAIRCDLLTPPEAPLLNEGLLASDLCFEELQPDKRVEMIKCLINNLSELLSYANTFLTNAHQPLRERELNEAFKFIQKRINGLQYDKYFDPLVALEFKTALGELVMRKAELLNTAEQILKYCKTVKKMTTAFRRFAKRSISGTWSMCLCGRSSKKNLLYLMGDVCVEDLNVYLPLSEGVAQELFKIQPSESQSRVR